MDGQRCQLFCRLRRGRGGPWVGLGCEVVGEGAEDVHDLAGWFVDCLSLSVRVKYDCSWAYVDRGGGCCRRLRL